VFAGLKIGDRNDTAIIAERLEAGVDPKELLAGIEGP
jgi:hypothetical protein